MSEIKLCPFCGSIPHVDDQDDERDGGYVPDDCVPVKCFIIGCNKCSFEIVKDTQEQTIAAWNLRTPLERESVAGDFRFVHYPGTGSGDRDVITYKGEEIADVHYGKNNAAKLLVRKGNKIESIKEAFAKLTDDERLGLFDGYCKDCGRFDGDSQRGCQCGNDE